MRLHLAALLVALAVTAFGPGSGRANAQMMAGSGSPVAWSTPADPWPSGSIGMGMGMGMAIPAATPTFPYSYYAAFPDRARQYVPYGPGDQFPFHGSPYGSINDRWSWSTLAGTAGAPRRYYYPPVR
ncbi:hypothetical protein [Tautonia plasticadhaerens]|uniref:Uncharacterized protein n=1 Tax=Tautonia plasticadhaerens TaxID=2527974 RepID=A0A518H4P3_9BACT|nr:hypothetical protein [Tautonia plasticadhaerens]QDV35800.1 hypothetical protein ElP_37080 [Tautonia plasticadhaerens]